MTIRLVPLTGQDAPIWLPPALDIYVTAMGYPRGTERHRHPLWQEHIGRAGWSAFGVLKTLDPTEITQQRAANRIIGAPIGDGREVMVGIAYGYRGAPDQWWNQQLRQGLRITGHSQHTIDQLTSNYFELTELHVHPSAQGQGIGQWLLGRLLTDRPERHVLLSTPEIDAERNRAWALYRRMGFMDVLRHFTFTGDPRPFAFLGRRLPLTPTAPENSTGAADPTGTDAVAAPTIETP